MNQLEQSRCEWADADHKLRMRRTLVWHAAITSKATSTATSIESGKKLPTNHKVYNALAKPGSKACKEFNSNKCLKGHDHPELQHVCLFCLATINRAFLQS